MLLLEYILHSPNSSVALSNVQRGAETMMMSPLASSPGWASNAAPGVRQWSIKMVSYHQKKTFFFSIWYIIQTHSEIWARLLGNLGLLSQLGRAYLLMWNSARQHEMNLFVRKLMIMKEEEHKCGVYSTMDKTKKLGRDRKKEKKQQHVTLRTVIWNADSW